MKKLIVLYIALLYFPSYATQTMLWNSKKMILPSIASIGNDSDLPKIANSSQRSHTSTTNPSLVTEIGVSAYALATIKDVNLADASTLIPSPESPTKQSGTETLLTYNPAILEWSIGTVEVGCNENTPTQLCYRLMVSTNEPMSNNPQLATSTIRFFYDSNLLNDLSIGSIQNGYTIVQGSGFGDTPGTGPYGTIFGFSSSAGNWVNFDIVANNGNPINLSSMPTHVLDLCFTPNACVTFPLCAPIVFDNNHVGWDTGINGDDGYLTDDEGIVGSYYINRNTGNALLADDEVINFLWTENVDLDGTTPIVFDGVVDMEGDRTGSTNVSGCIENACVNCPVAGIDEVSVIYVDGNSDGSNDGLSWENAYHNLSEAILLSNDCPQISEIWVKQGTYLPGLGDDRSQSFLIKNKLKIIGGFPASISSPTMNDRNVSAYLSILSGDIGIANNSEDNAYHIIKNLACDTLFLYGVTIENGYGNGSASADKEGAGISNAGALILDQVTIRNCEATVRGSAIQNLVNSYLEMKECQLSSNIGPNEIYIENGSVIIINGEVIVNE